MKKLFVAALLFISIFTYSQETFWLVEEELTQYLEEFVEDSEKRNYMTRSQLSKKIDYILFSEEGRFKSDEEGNLTLGAAHRKSKGVWISKEIADSPLLLKLVIYHEIGHLLKYDEIHTCYKCYHIMSEHFPDDPGPYRDPEYLEEKIDEFFEWLKS